MRILKYILIFQFLLLNKVYAQKGTDSSQIRLINGKSYLIHKVQKGQGLNMILRQYNIELSSLEEANKDKNLNKLKKNEIILIPLISSKKNATDTLQAAKKINEAHANADDNKSEIPRNHIVQPGESLFKIAQKYKVTVSELVRWNAIKNNTIEVGKELIVNQKGVIKPFQAWNQKNGSVQSGGSRIISPLQNQEEVIVQSGYLIISEEPGQVLHPTLPVGTFILVKNIDSEKELLLMVTGQMASKIESNFVITIGSDWAQKLNVGSGLTRVSVKYAN